jgi:hypothetical protein
MSLGVTVPILRSRKNNSFTRVPAQRVREKELG